MNASSESGECATRISTVRSFSLRLFCFGNRGEDVATVALVLRERLLGLLRLRGEQPPLELLPSSPVVPHARGLRGEDETEEMRGILLENRVGLGGGDVRVTRDDRDPPIVVAQVGIE